MLKGQGASSGIAIGKAVVLKENKLIIEKKAVSNSTIEEARLFQAIENGKKQIKALQQSMAEQLGAKNKEIFETHLLIIESPELIDATKEKIRKDKVNAEYALQMTTEELVGVFEAMKNEYFRERAADIRDVSQRLLTILLGQGTVSITDINEECVLVARDLTPSDTAQINRDKILGYLTETGGITSHAAIIARSLEIPAVVGAGAGVLEINDGDLLILDGAAGLVFVNPDQDLISRYRYKKAELMESRSKLVEFKEAPSITADGRKIEIAANIGSVEEADQALENGADGIGLFRTEFLFIARESLPTEEEQLEIYRAVLEKMGGKPVIIRTLDVGGDKIVPSLPIEKEENPFLGYRAIRLCLDRNDLFKTQLRALLRASVYGNLKIMFPMIATIEEFRQAKAVVVECQKDLRQKRLRFIKDLPVGMMVEVPSAAISSDLFAKEADFFSIGSNDLLQYTLAVDRMNEKVAYLYNYFNPSVLRLIRTVINHAHQEGKWVGICGEMAAVPELVPVLLGLGLDELSMNSSAVLNARKIIRNISYVQAKALADEIQLAGTSEEVKEMAVDWKL